MMLWEEERWKGGAIRMKVMRENKESRRKDWINGWSAGGNYVFMCKLVGGGVYVMALCLCVVIYSSITNLTWFSFFLVRQKPPQSVRLDCCCSGLLSLLFASSCCPISPWETEWCANTSNKCCSLFSNGGAKNNTQSPKLIVRVVLKYSSWWHYLADNSYCCDSNE